MNRRFLIPLFFLVLVSMACSFSGLGANTQATQAPQYKPTDIPPTATPQRKTVTEFKDDFGVANSDWSDPFVVTTQAPGGKVNTKMVVTDGKMVVDFADNETYLYKFYNNPIKGNVVLETKFQAGGKLTNGIALVCRANTDMTKWYEFRVSSLSTYAIMLYDASRRDTGQNPYVELKKGAIPVDKMGPNKQNVFRGICDGTTLSLETNNNKIASIQDDTIKEDGLVGLGAMDDGELPVTIFYDYFYATQPK